MILGDNPCKSSHLRATLATFLPCVRPIPMLYGLSTQCNFRTTPSPPARIFPGPFSPPSRLVPNPQLCIASLLQWLCYHISSSTSRHWLLPSLRWSRGVSPLAHTVVQRSKSTSRTWPICWNSCVGDMRLYYKAARRCPRPQSRCNTPTTLAGSTPETTTTPREGEFVPEPQNIVLAHVVDLGFIRGGY